MIKVNLAPPTTKRPRRATGGGGELNLGLLFGGILAALVLIIGGWWLSISLESRRLTAEIENNRRELDRLKPIIAAGQRYRRERDELERRLNAIETVARNQARPVYLLDAMADTLPPDLWLTRLEERGPAVPDDLRPDYVRAVEEAQGLAETAARHAWDDDSWIAFAGSAAALRGDAARARGIFEDRRAR